MAERLNVRVTVEAVDAKDGSAFWSDNQGWSGVPYGEFVWFQSLLHEVQAKMLAAGFERAKTKGGKDK